MQEIVLLGMQQNTQFSYLIPKDLGPQRPVWWLPHIIVWNYATSLWAPKSSSTKNFLPPGCTTSGLRCLRFLRSLLHSWDARDTWDLWDTWDKRPYTGYNWEQPHHIYNIWNSCNGFLCICNEYIWDRYFLISYNKQTIYFISAITLFQICWCILWKHDKHHWTLEFQE